MTTPTPVNEFMLNIEKSLKERDLAEGTVKFYLKTLYMLNDRKPFKSLAFLKKKDDIAGKLEKYAESSQKTILGAICSVLSPYKERGPYKKTYEYYCQLVKEKNGVAPETPAGEKTERERESWITWEDVQKRRNELRESVSGIGKTATADQFNELLNYVVLSLYTLIQPRRNQDYMDMVVVKKWTESMPTDKNYLDMNGGKKPTQFVFNKYKTAKTHGQQKFSIPDELAEVLTKYITHHPLRPKGRPKEYSFPLLVSAAGEPLTSVNAITRILNHIFKKKIGSSMLRHIFLSNKYDLSEMKEDAEAMGHTVGTQRNYLRTEPEGGEPKI